MKYKNKAKKKTSKAIKIGGWIIAIALLAAGTSLVIALRWYNQSLKPFTPGSTQQVSFSVVEGTPTSKVAQDLEDRDIINSQRAMLVYLRLNESSNNIQAGDFAVSPGNTTQEIIGILSKGLKKDASFTFLPGKRLDQISDSLILAGFSEDEVNIGLSAASHLGHPINKYKPEGATLEGYIYPETFSIGSETTVTELVSKSMDEFDELLTPQLIADLDAQGLSVHEAIILGSIVEKEVAREDERALVAQVFLKRLQDGITLGSDPTFRYASEVFDLPLRTDLDNPYNTRIYGGLPPGPIANMSITSLEALANPSPTDYLFFVSGDDGVTRFTRTLAEHEAAVAEFCDINCRL